MLTWNIDNEKNLVIKQTYTTKKLSKTSSNNDSTLNTRNYSTLNTRKWYKGLINPISIFNKKGILKQPQIKPIFTMDLETVYLDSIKSEVVIAISSCGFNKGVLENKIFLIDPSLLLTDYDLAPKVYGLLDIDKTETIKIKGVTHDIVSDIHFNDLENLLVKDSSKVFNQKKMV
jgi:hypothetical protein